MSDMATSLITGAVFGLTAGLSPGPLLTLVISETVKHKKAEGIKVAIAPLLTDIPIVFITLFTLSRFTNFDMVLGVVAIVGGLYLAYLGFQSLKTRDMEIDIKIIKPRSLKKGMIVNVLSPHAYLFWITIGAPFTFHAYENSLGSAAVFIIVFYVLLVGSKMGIALLIDKSRYFLENKFILGLCEFLV